MSQISVTFASKVNETVSAVDDAIALATAANNIADQPVGDAAKQHILSKVMSSLHDARAMLIKPTGPLSEPLLGDND